MRNDFSTEEITLTLKIERPEIRTENLNVKRSMQFVVALVTLAIASLIFF